MNFPSVDSIISRQRCRQWMPLITQQLRLRHLYSVIAYNVTSDKCGSFYFTLHLTTMSSPFYTSEKINNNNPKWTELELSDSTPLSVSGVVLRIWQSQEKDEMDSVITTWGINFSGLVYLGTKLSEIHPMYFKENSVILQLRGGYFTSHKTIKVSLREPLPFIDNLNIISNEENTKPFKYTANVVPKGDVKISYDSEKLRRLHSLQISIRNKTIDAKIVREKIDLKCGNFDGDKKDKENEGEASSSCASNVRYAPQLLTMNSLNKMLQDKPTRSQKKEITKLKKEIEIFKFRTKLLVKEKNRKLQKLRQLKQNYTTLFESNEERESQLMENYHTLSKDVEKMKEWRRDQIQLREDLQLYSAQLYHRRRQLMSQLLFIYPIKHIKDNNYTINGIYLPDADKIADSSDGGLSVALGYVAHILTMCSYFLQVPLRYPVFHMGSRSHIVDQISSILLEKDREFPLYTRGKDRMQFNYAVYLLNKNIAQLRLLCGLQTPDLRATLNNLLTFLQGKEHRDVLLNRNETTKLVSNQNDKSSSCSEKSKLVKVLEDFKFSVPNQSAVIKQIKKRSEEEEAHGLSDTLYIPEAYISKQISSDTFKSYLSSNSSIVSSVSGKVGEKFHSPSNSSQSSSQSNSTVKMNLNKNCDIRVGRNTPMTVNNEVIEEGTDPLAINFCNYEGEIKVFTERRREKEIINTFKGDVSVSNICKDIEDKDVNAQSKIREETKEEVIYFKEVNTSKIIPFSKINNISEGLNTSEELIVSKKSNFCKEVNTHKDSTLQKSTNPLKFSKEKVQNGIEIQQSFSKQKRKSRSVGSYKSDEKPELRDMNEVGSDPVLNTSPETIKNKVDDLDLVMLPESVEDRQSEFLQKWLDSGPALISSEENLYPEEILGTVEENLLAIRTDALANTTSFNLVKPKF